jgi:hypothetical protein
MTELPECVDVWVDELLDAKAWLGRRDRPRGELTDIALI